MTNKENNFAKDINVPSKEQVIIDGVKVLKEKINMCFILLLNKLETPETIEQTIYEHLDAFVKEWSTQLAHKTQEFEQLQEKYEALKLENEEGYEIVDELKHECEELKSYAQRQENQRETYYKEFLKKAKALEEIDKVINNIFDRCLGHKTDSCTPVHNVCEKLINILDIINKAKDGNNE